MIDLDSAMLIEPASAVSGQVPSATETEATLTLDSVLRESGFSERSVHLSRGDVFERHGATSPEHEMYVRPNGRFAREELARDQAMGVVEEFDKWSKEVSSSNFDEWNDIPDDGSNPLPLFMKASPDVVMDPEEFQRWWSDLLIDIVGNFLYDLMTGLIADQQETWTSQMPGPLVTMNELNLSNWTGELFQGLSPLTDFVDIPMVDAGNGQMYGAYYAPDGSVTRFVAHDEDGDGAFDAVYMRTSDGDWFVATETDENGDPRWRPSDPPEHFPEPRNTEED